MYKKERSLLVGSFSLQTDGMVDVGHARHGSVAPDLPQRDQLVGEVDLPNLRGPLERVEGALERVRVGEVGGRRGRGRPDVELVVGQEPLDGREGRRRLHPVVAVGHGHRRLRVVQALVTRGHEVVVVVVAVVVAAAVVAVVHAVLLLLVLEPVVLLLEPVVVHEVGL